MRRGGLEASVACMNKALQEQRKSRAQTADEELKSRDGAKTISEMEASVSSEQQLRLAARAVNVTEEDGGLQAELALREARQHRAWKERWPCHVCRLCCLHRIYTWICMLSFVPVFYAAVGTPHIRYQDVFPGTCIRDRARAPSPSPPHSSVGP